MSWLFHDYLYIWLHDITIANLNWTNKLAVTYKPKFTKFKSYLTQSHLTKIGLQLNEFISSMSKFYNIIAQKNQPIFIKQKPIFDFRRRPEQFCFKYFKTN